MFQVRFNALWYFKAKNDQEVYEVFICVYSNNTPLTGLTYQKIRTGEVDLEKRLERGKKGYRKEPFGQSFWYLFFVQAF